MSGEFIKNPFRIPICLQAMGGKKGVRRRTPLLLYRDEQMCYTTECTHPDCKGTGSARNSSRCTISIFIGLDCMTASTEYLYILSISLDNTEIKFRSIGATIPPHGNDMVYF